MIAIVLLISGLLTFVIADRRPAGLLVSDLGFFGAGWGAFVSIIVVISAALFGGDAISGEFQNRTGYFSVPNPIRRSVIYAGKWIAALVASTLVLLVYAGVIVANSLYYFGLTIPNEFLESMLFAWVYLVAVLALAFAFSSLFKSNAISVLMTVITVLIVFNVIDTAAGTLAGIEPWFSLTYGGSIVTSILTVPYPKPVSTQSFGPPSGGFSVTTYTPPVWEGLIILGVYFFVLSIIGLWLFERKDFTS